jgi:hypothetical protein
VRTGELARRRKGAGAPTEPVEVPGWVQPLPVPVHVGTPR